MKKKGFLLSILGLFLVLAFSLTANATAEITYNYNVNDVTVEIFDCLDASCSTVRPFSGTLPDGNSTTNGKLTISYPTDLATSYGYGVFHFSKGTAPVVKLATWNGNGATTQDITLSKIKTCRSVVDTFSVTNDAKPNVPLVFNIDASLDATTRSSFKLLSNPVAFIPESYVQEFFSSDVKVSLKINRDDFEPVVNQQVKEFKALDGTAIKADESIRTEFTWTPDSTGVFTATVTSEVTDDQCENTDQQSSVKIFEVLSQEPKGECYTLLNDLATTNPNSKVGEVVKATFSKISNHADSSGALTSLPTNVNYRVTDANGHTVFSKTETLGANADSVLKTSHSFEFTALNEGNHAITVEGLSESSQCNGLTNRGELVAQVLFISNPKTFDVKFKLVDSSTGQSVEDADVRLTASNFDETKVSDNNGEALFVDLDPATYNYEVTHPDFKIATGSVVVKDSDVDITIALERNQLPPRSEHDVTFVVENSATSQPVSGVFVEFLGKDSQGNSVSLAGFTDLSGRLLFLDVKDGEYSFTVSHKDFLTATGKVVLTSTTGDIEVRVKLSPGIQPVVPAKKEDLSLHVSSIRVPAAFESSPGDRLEVALTFENNGNTKLDNVRATATILELGSRGSAGPFDLKQGDSLTKRLLVDLPDDTEPGTYMLRVTLANDRTHRVIHREIEVS